nr:hypothetical protein [Tanacetum cinerariifolium]
MSYRWRKDLQKALSKDKLPTRGPDIRRHKWMVKIKTYTRSCSLVSSSTSIRVIPKRPFSPTHYHLISNILNRMGTRRKMHEWLGVYRTIHGRLSQ